VAVQCTDGNQTPFIPATQFRIFEDSQPVLDYGVETLKVPERLVMAFLIPTMADGLEQPIVDGALRALVWKRPRDLWSTVHYRPFRPWNLTATLIGEIIEIARPEEISVAADRPIFLADHESAGQALDRANHGIAHSNLWDAIAEATHACAGVVAADAEPHLVIYSPSYIPDPTGHQAQRQASLGLTIPIHCIAWESNPFLEALCESSQGSFHLVEGDEKVVETVEQLYVRLLARYSVSYRGMAHAAAGHIQVRTSEGWGKAALHFKRQRRRSFLDREFE
jgi:hypothetical protein